MGNGTGAVRFIDLFASEAHAGDAALKRLMALDEPERLALVTAAASALEVSVAPEMRNLGRVWAALDESIGPSRSMLEALMCRHPRLLQAHERLASVYALGQRAEGAIARGLAARRFRREAEAWKTLRSSVMADVERDAKQLVDEMQILAKEPAGKRAKARDAALRKQIEEDTQEMLRRWEEGQKSRGMKPAKSAASKARTELPKVSDIRADAKQAIEDLENSWAIQAETLEKRARSAPQSAAVKNARMKTILTKTKDAAVTRSRLGYRTRSLARFGNVEELGRSLHGRVFGRLRARVPILGKIGPDAEAFIEAAGVIAQARPMQPGPGNVKLLQKWAAGKGAGLKRAELETVDGYRDNLRGLMPEEIGLQIGVLDAMFYRRAFELMADIPPELRSRIKLEIVRGPMWGVKAKGALQQFGDGSALLTDIRRSESVLIGLGEFKAGFDEGLLEQLFVRSDNRKHLLDVEFIDSAGAVRVRKLVSHLSPDDKLVSFTKAPVYVHSRPEVTRLDVDQIAACDRMIEEQFRSGRELWAIPLPFTWEDNEKVASAMLEEAIRLLSKTSWAKP